MSRSAQVDWPMYSALPGDPAVDGATWLLGRWALAAEGGDVATAAASSVRLLLLTGSLSCGSASCWLLLPGPVLSSETWLLSLLLRMTGTLDLVEDDVLKLSYVRSA